MEIVVVGEEETMLRDARGRERERNEKQVRQASVGWPKGW